MRRGEKRPPSPLPVSDSLELRARAPAPELPLPSLTSSGGEMSPYLC